MKINISFECISNPQRNIYKLLPKNLIANKIDKERKCIMKNTNKIKNIKYEKIIEFRKLSN